MLEGMIRLSGLVSDSIVDGPGLRLAVFVQGCPHRCAGCHNPQTHDFEGGYDESVENILAQLDKNPLLSGVTLTGGEPVSHAGALLPLAKGVRARGKNIVLYTGYTFEQLLEMGDTSPDIPALLELCDTIVDGPFILEQRSLMLKFRGSTNQRILDAHASLKQGSAVEREL